MGTKRKKYRYTPGGISFRIEEWPTCGKCRRKLNPESLSDNAYKENIDNDGILTIDWICKCQTRCITLLDTAGPTGPGIDIEPLLSMLGEAK
jgi:hypothetical protein